MMQRGDFPCQAVFDTSPFLSQAEVGLDPVDRVLDGLKFQSAVFSRMELSGEWGFAKDGLQGAPFHVVLEGEMWVELAGWPALRLATGDVVILPGGEAHHLMSAVGSPLTPFRSVLAEQGVVPWRPGTRIKPFVLRFGSGDGARTRLITGVFGFGDRRENPILAALPRIFHLSADQIAVAPARTWLALTVQALEEEIGSGRPGAASVAARLADLLFVQAVRLHLAADGPKDAGWLRGVGDPAIGRALALIHAHPGRPWSVATLAEAAGMSRSRFARRFAELVGRTPLDYLTRWRMHEAAGRLAETGTPLAALADQAGYASEVAFSKAFKRWAGCSPSEFRRRARSGP